MAPSSERVPAASIREFQAGDEVQFRRLNEEWINHYFRMEARDEAALTDPQTGIIAPGGRIFFAVIDEQYVGCCALVRVSADEFEVAKMAVTESCRGRGIGRLLMDAVVAAARQSGAHHLTLETNHRMTPAIALYESVGFEHVPRHLWKPSEYERSNVRMEMKLG